jgi:septum formation protein
MNTLLLGSSSFSRQQLLTKAAIPFIVVGHTADESQCKRSSSLSDMVVDIARLKMEHVVMPEGQEGEYSFVLTADTLTQDPTGRICGKPVDYADAVSMLKAAQKGCMRAGTAFCLEKKVYRQGKWKTVASQEGYNQAEYIFHVPDEQLDNYFAHSTLYLQVAGGVAIEEYGIQYFREIRGSFSAVIGLPMAEVYDALIKMGFF